jgi:steroid delta-isomerase-like uncharacterized protein
VDQIGSVGGGRAAEENERKYREVFERVWNRGDLDYVDVAYHPEYVFHSPAEPEPIRGHEEWKAFINRIRTAFPDVHVEIEETIAAGDGVAGRLRMRMTHTGPYLGLPPTGTVIDATQIVWGRFEDGQMREAWQEIDALGVLRQLGVVPPEGVGPAGLLGWAFRTIARIAWLSARTRAPT